MLPEASRVGLDNNLALLAASARYFHEEGLADGADESEAGDKAGAGAPNGGGNQTTPGVGGTAPGGGGSGGDTGAGSPNGGSGATGRARYAYT